MTLRAQHVAYYEDDVLVRRQRIQIKQPQQCRRRIYNLHKLQIAHSQHPIRETWAEGESAMFITMGERTANN